jgi:hypothetical protein
MQGHGRLSAPRLPCRWAVHDTLGAAASSASADAARDAGHGPLADPSQRMGRCARGAFDPHGASERMEKLCHMPGVQGLPPGASALPQTALRGIVPGELHSPALQLDGKH